MACAQDKISVRSWVVKSFKWFTCGMLGSKPRSVKEAVYEAAKALGEILGFVYFGFRPVSCDPPRLAKAQGRY